MDSFRRRPEDDDEKHYDSEPEDLGDLQISMDSFPVWPEDDEKEYWEMVEEEIGPKPEDPDSEAMKEYLEDLQAYKTMLLPLGAFDPIPLDDKYSQDGARFAVEEYNRTQEGQVLELKRVVKAMMGSFDLEITLETSDGKFYLARVVVWSSISMPYGFKFRYFKPLDTNPELVN